jgi:hypothetical protein
MSIRSRLERLERALPVHASLWEVFCGAADPADARAIAEFARDRNPPAWRPPAPEVRELQALVRRRDDLPEMAACEKGRLASPALTRAARRSIERAVKFLGREADRVQAEADALIAASPDLRADRNLLDGLTHLRELENLSTLTLNNTRVNDDGLAHLAEMKSRSTLWLMKTNVSGSGLPRLRPLKTLTTLYLDDSMIDDDGLKHLKELPQLQVLSLRRTTITDAGLSELKAAPNLTW